MFENIQPVTLLFLNFEVMLLLLLIYIGIGEVMLLTLFRVSVIFLVFIFDVWALDE